MTLQVQLGSLLHLLTEGCVRTGLRDQEADSDRPILGGLAPVSSVKCGTSARSERQGSCAGRDSGEQRTASDVHKSLRGVVFDISWGMEPKSASRARSDSDHARYM